MHNFLHYQTTHRCAMFVLKCKLHITSLKVILLSHNKNDIYNFTDRTTYCDTSIVYTVTYISSIIFR